jgi:hypothetical protein
MATALCWHGRTVPTFGDVEREEGRRRGLFRERCPRYVRDAIAILESVSAGPGSEPAAGPPSGDRP